MLLPYDRQDDLSDLIQLALKEDLGNGDITTQAIFKNQRQAKGTFYAKADGVLAGMELAKHIFKIISEDVQFEILKNDGETTKPKDIIARVSGPADSLLIGERTVLNFMQRMGGIASLTRMFADKIAHTKAKILDTRKTVPGHRITDKWAVQLGGGENHRIRLDDRFLIKENHITVAGGISEAISSCVQFKDQKMLTAPIEIEIKNLDEFRLVLDKHASDVDYIMLDNMSLKDMKKAVEINNGLCKIEASGNVTLETVQAIAETGVDYISSGSLTHSVKALDISLIFEM
ncbi:carboxylating nicotinate-nucleotide diphosphorylase [bacterium]|nr:MAG: carboxylating nicotinate-nucleotide diphosphorylase [bacterium]